MSAAPLPMLSDAEYERLRRAGYAGPMSERLPETVAAWPAEATHWFMSLTEQGTVLGPCTIGALGPVERAVCVHCGKPICRQWARGRRAWVHGELPGAPRTAMLCAGGEDVAEPRPVQRWRVVCEDGEVRHEGTFASMAEADRWAMWGHACTNRHDVEVAG